MTEKKKTTTKRPVVMVDGKKFDKTRIIPKVPPTTDQIAARFWPKVNKNGPDPQVEGVEGNCWDWNASTRGGRGGEYGQFRVMTGMIQEAHKVAWELETGKKVPEGMVVVATCRRGLCVRPDHHVVTTRKGAAAWRSPVGAANGQSGIRGVTWNSRMGKWKASMTMDGMQVHGGYHKDKQDAVDAVLRLRTKFYAEKIAQAKEESHRLMQDAE